MLLRQSLEASELADRLVSRSSSRATARSGGFGRANPAPMLRWQTALGNQQVARLVRDGRLTPQGQLLRERCGSGGDARQLAKSSSPGLNINPVSRQTIQRGFFDDAVAAAGEAYDATASAAQSGYQAVAGAASSAYQSASSVASDGAAVVASGVKAATNTVSAAGAGISSAVSAAAESLSPDPEKTRTKLAGQVDATRQQVVAAGPDGIQADPARVASINQQMGGLKAQAATASIPLNPGFLPEIGSIGAAIAEGLAAIAAFVLGAPVWVIVLVAVIVLAIIALVIYLLRDTHKYPDPQAPPKADPKTAPKTGPKTDPERPGPDPTVDPIPPLPQEREPPDCCAGSFPLVPVRIDKGKKSRRYYGKTIKVHDSRGKHWRNTEPSGPDTSCDVGYLEAVARQGPETVGPCLKAWIAAVEAKDTDIHGGQLGSDTAPRRIEIVTQVVAEGEEINANRYWGDVGEPVGVDVTTGHVTTKARVDGLPDKAHAIPQEARPT